ncbi:MAG: regulatory protein RecX [Deltaproteobacteria bacterium]|nr:regulatory protein RecX [Deltaproteobacteria bacterium]
MSGHPARKKNAREKPPAHVKAVDLLSRSGHSRRELARKLRQRNYGPDEIEAGVRFVEDRNFLNEERDAEAAARTLCGRGYWGLAVRARLVTRGFPKSAIDRALDQMETETPVDKALARMLPAKLPADLKARQRLALKIVRRGFPVSLVRRRFDDLPSEMLETAEAEFPDHDGCDEE